MLRSFIPDPEIFDACHRKTELFDLQLWQFVRGALINCVMLKDGGRVIESDIVQRLSEACGASRRSDAINTAMIEIIKSSRRSIKLDNVASTTVTDVICDVYDKYKPDTIVSVSECAPDFEPNRDITTINNYDGCQFERTRHAYASDLGPADLMRPEDLSSQLCAALRWAQKITIIDKQIGQTSGNMASFAEGIAHVLACGLQRSIHTDLELEIITEEKSRISGEETNYEKDKKLEVNTSAYQTLKDRFTPKLIKALPKSISLVTVRVKHDSTKRRVLHDRYLSTEHVTICLTRGFDLLNEDNELLRQSIRLAEQHFGHVEQCRALDDVFAPIVGEAVKSRARLHRA